jgi:AAA domain
MPSQQDDEPTDIVAEAEKLKAVEAARRRAIAPAQRPRRATNESAKGSYAQAALKREREAVASASKGERESTTNAALLALGRHVAAGYLTEQEVRREIESACYVNGFIQDDYRGSAERFWKVKGNRSLRDGVAKGPRDYSQRGTKAEPEPNVVEVDDISGGARRKRKVRHGNEIDDGSGVVITMKSMASVESDVSHWIWEHDESGYIELGEICVFAGKGAAGKSTAARWVAANITQGTLPGAWLGHPQNVAAIFYEETLKTRVIPGLKAAGADMSRMMFPEIQIDGEDGGDLVITSKVYRDAFVKSLKENEIRCVIFDPVMNLLGAGVDTNKSNEVRPAMRAIKEIAEEINGFVLLVAHLNKGNNRDVIESVTGSGAFAQYPRQVVLFMERGDNEDDPLGVRVMEQRKNNSGRMIRAYEYQLVSEPVEVLPGLHRDFTVFKQLGPSKVSLRDIVDGNLEGDDGGARLGEMTEWLEEFLQINQPCTPPKVYSEGNSVDRYPPTSLRRALKKLRGASVSHPTKDNQRGRVWVLPGHPLHPDSRKQRR